MKSIIGVSRASRLLSAKHLVDWMEFKRSPFRVTLTRRYFILNVRCVRAKEIVKSGMLRIQPRFPLFRLCVGRVGEPVGLIYFEERGYPFRSRSSTM